MKWKTWLSLWDHFRVTLKKGIKNFDTDSILDKFLFIFSIMNKPVSLKILSYTIHLYYNNEYIGNNNDTIHIMY